MKKKIFSILFALVLVLSFSLVTAVPVAAQVDEVWVDDDAAEDWYDDPTHFATIQAGIDAVELNGTVYVADGNYNATIFNSTQGGLEEGWWFVTINESLDLIGESRDGVILDGTGLYNEYRSAGIWVSASNVTIKNLTIQNFYVSEPSHYSYGLVSWEKFRNFNTAEPHVLPLSYVTAENLKVVDCQASLYFMMTEHATVKDCIVEGSKADGIWIAMGSSYAMVEGNIVTNSADHGIWVGGASWCPPVDCPNATITDNNINGAREGGISFVNSAGATISGNTITNVAAEGWSVGALSLKDGCSDVEAFDNNIYDNDGSWGGYSGTGHGVGIDGTPSNINLYLNNIYDNTGYGVYNYSTVNVTATNNWWGDASGPSGVGVGSGDSVSTNVLFVPWLKALPMSSFIIDHAKVDFKKKADDDKVRVQGKLELDLDNGDGVNIFEDVIVTVGPLPETIKMVEKGKKGEKWQYQRPKGGEGNIKHMTINWKNGKFDIRMDKADLTGVTNPVIISVQIGDDVGSVSILMREKKHHWDYKAK